MLSASRSLETPAPRPVHRLQHECVPPTRACIQCIRVRSILEYVSYTEARKTGVIVTECKVGPLVLACHQCSDQSSYNCNILSASIVSTLVQCIVLIISSTMMTQSRVGHGYVRSQNRSSMYPVVKLTMPAVSNRSRSNKGVVMNQSIYRT